MILLPVEAPTKGVAIVLGVIVPAVPVAPPLPVIVLAAGITPVKCCIHNLVEHFRLIFLATDCGQFLIWTLKNYHAG